MPSRYRLWQVYVAVHNNHRIQVFTAEGMFGRRGEGMRELYSITIDTSDKSFKKVLEDVK